MFLKQILFFGCYHSTLVKHLLVSGGLSSKTFVSRFQLWFIGKVGRILHFPSENDDVGYF